MINDGHHNLTANSNNIRSIGTFREIENSKIWSIEGRERRNKAFWELLLTEMQTKKKEKQNCAVC